jgi:hypothetical protein
MANSTTNLDLISSTQASKEITANALFDASSQAVIYGRRASTTSSLTWGYYGGNLNIGSTSTPISNGTIQLTASATNYVQASATTGAVSVNTTGFTTGSIPLYTIVTGASTVTSYTDNRPNPLIVGGGGFTNPMTTINDLIVGGTSGTPTRLPVGTSGQVLTVNSSGNVVWASTSASLTNPMTTAGDIIVGGTGGTPTRLGIGTNNQVLTVSSGALAWATPSGGGGGSSIPSSIALKPYPVKQSILSSATVQYSRFDGDMQFLGSTSGYVVPDLIYAFPINLPFNLTNCNIGVYFAASQTLTFFVGFYTDNGGAPGSLIQQITISNSNTSSPNVPTLGTSLLTSTLTKGTWYWILYATSNTSNVSCPSSEATYVQVGRPNLGYNSNNNQANFFIVYNNGASVTALPSNAPTTGWNFGVGYGSAVTKTNPVIVFDTAGMTY